MDVNDRNHRWHSSFGLFRETEEPNRIYTKSRRFQLSFAVVAAALLIVTVVFVVIQVNRPSKEIIAEAKRFINREEKKSKIDVGIIPESKIHPNHRYDQKPPGNEIMERMMKDIYKEWIPEEDPKGRNNILDIIKRIEMREELRRNSGTLAKPILLKGIYRKNEKTQAGQTDANMEYFKEINDLLQGENSSTEEEITFRGSPFQLKNQGDGIGELTGKSSEGMRKKWKKPITVMLDIYPITQTGEEIVEGRKKPFIVSKPIPSGGRNIAYTLLPKKKDGIPKNKRMIMKLNLFPKNDLDSPKRRTFGWFKKKPEDHVCHLIGHTSEWKPVTAEWKDKNGDWIKANYVTLKYWDREFK